MTQWNAKPSEEQAGLSPTLGHSGHVRVALDFGQAGL